MRKSSRRYSIFLCVTLALMACAIGVSAVYNASRDPGVLDRETFQAIVATLLICGLGTSLVATWFKVSAQDEVVRVADRVSLYWGWMIGTAIWIFTVWTASLPERVVDAISSSSGDSLFYLSEAEAAYFGGGFIFMLIVLACWCIVRFGWWLAKR